MSNMTLPCLGKCFTKVEPADLVRLLTWFFSTTDNPGVAPTCSVGEVLATAMQLRAECFCWQHHPRTWELSCISVCSFSCANKQPITLGSYSAFSCFPHVWHQGFWHSSWVLIPNAHCQHQTQAAWFFLQQWYLMTNATRGLACQNQERVHQWWQQWIQCQCHGSAPLDTDCNTAPNWRWQGVRDSHQLLGMLSMTNMTLLTKTAMHQQMGAVFNLPSLSPAMEFSQKLGAVKQYWQLATALNSPSPEPFDPPRSSQGWHCLLWWGCGCGGLREYGRSRWRLCIMSVSKDNTGQDDDESDSETDLWESIADSGPESVTGDDCLTCAQTYQWCSSKVCPKDVLQKGAGLW